MLAEFPENYSVLLAGPPGVGKFEFCLDKVKDWLKNGERVLYLTTERSLDEIKSTAEKFGLDIEEYKNKTLFFVDCHSWSWGIGMRLAEGSGTIKAPNIMDITIALEKAIQNMECPIRIVFDSLSPLFLYIDVPSMKKFFHFLTSKTKSEYGFIMYTLQEGVHDPNIRNSLSELVDSFLEMQYDEEAGGSGRRLRVHHSRDTPPDNSWKKFRIGETGLEMV